MKMNGSKLRGQPNSQKMKFLVKLAIKQATQISQWVIFSIKKLFIQQSLRKSLPTGLKLSLDSSLITQSYGFS